MLQFDDHVTLQSILAGATCADELWKSPARMTRIDRESEVLLGDVIVSPIDEPISDIDKRFRGLFEVTCCQVQLLFVSGYWCRESVSIKTKRRRGKPHLVPADTQAFAGGAAGLAFACCFTS